MWEIRCVALRPTTLSADSPTALSMADSPTSRGGGALPVSPSDCVFYLLAALVMYIMLRRIMTTLVPPRSHAE